MWTRRVRCVVIASTLAAGCGTGGDEVAVPEVQPEPSTSIVSVPDRRPAITSITSITSVDETVTAPSSATPTEPSPAQGPPATASTSSTTSSTSTTTSTTTTSTTTSTTLPVSPERDMVGNELAATHLAFDSLARSNTGASMTVVRHGEIVLSRASGRTLDREPATGDTPMVVASVSKIVVAMGIARLAEQGRIDVNAPVPWDDLGLDPHPAWDDVTVRELLDHRSGLAKAQASWFTGGGDCRSHVSTLLTPPPSADRGEWVYSNGNYCLLGLLVEAESQLPLDAALQILVFDPIDVDGLHLTDDGLLPGDIPHVEGVGRLARLGGAGNLVVSTDDLAMMLGRASDADRSVLRAPGVFTDQYGYGHTGTITGAKSCVWVVDEGSTVVATTIAGNSVASGGDVCDRVVTAVAADLGLGDAPPRRTP